jgi:hypothetical protein
MNDASDLARAAAILAVWYLSASSVVYTRYR